MEAKYIIAELPTGVGTCLGAVIFPAYMDHRATVIGLNLDVANIHSAGLCVKDADGKFVAYGQSRSLKIDSKEGDSALLNRLGS